MSIITKTHHSIRVVKISSVPNAEEFKEWLENMACPILMGETDPYDWAYEYDYLEFIKIKPFE